MFIYTRPPACSPSVSSPGDIVVITTTRHDVEYIKKLEII